MPPSIRRRRLTVLASAAIAALAAFAPAHAAGQSSPPRSGQSPRPSTPSSNTLSRTVEIGGTTSAPISWVDDATIMPPQRGAVTMSALGWQGTGASEFDFPVVGAVVGVAPRVQIGLSAPYVVGNDTSGVTAGWGTTYLS